MSVKRTHERAAVRVARKLVSEIRRRRLRPGAQLASEHRMVEKFAVARAPIREALRFLELQGALRIKAGYQKVNLKPPLVKSPPANI